MRSTTSNLKDIFGLIVYALFHHNELQIYLFQTEYPTHLRHTDELFMVDTHKICHFLCVFYSVQLQSRQLFRLWSLTLGDSGCNIHWPFYSFSFITLNIHHLNLSLHLFFADEFLFDLYRFLPYGSKRIIVCLKIWIEKDRKYVFILVDNSLEQIHCLEAK